MTVLLIFFLILIPCWMPNSAEGAKPPDPTAIAPEHDRVTGTLTELDLSKRKAVLRTDLGRSILLEVNRPELFQDLSLGDRVTIEVDDNGEVRKLMGIAIPEFGITQRPPPRSEGDSREHVR